MSSSPDDAEAVEPLTDPVSETTAPETEEPAAETIADEPATVAPAVIAEPEAPANLKRWYVVKVASGREESIKKAIEREIKIEGLENFFGQIVIPVEKVRMIKKVKETKNGEKITKEKPYIKETKKFPGYLMAEVEFNAEILTLFRDVSGVGDFVGATGPGKPPPPMADLDVQRMLYGMMPGDKGTPVKSTIVKLDFEKGDKVRIREGAFANYEGEVKTITDSKDGETPKVTVEVQVLGRPVPIEMEYFQVDKI